MPAAGTVSRSTEKSDKLHEKLQRLVARAPYLYTHLFIESAKGAVIKDVDGNSYVDFAGGIGTLNVGHNHPKVVEALHAQADKFLHTSFHVMPYESYLRVAEKLIAAAPGKFAKKAVFFNSGAEAVENAVKMARTFTKRPGIISFENSFHGRTYMALTLTGKDKPYRTAIGPFPGEVYRAPYPYAYRAPEGVSPESLSAHCLEALERVMTYQTSPDRVAAIIVEPVLGEGGFVPATAEFMQGLRKLCDRHGIVLISDEIQTGFGRTGRMFAIEHFGVIPDLVTVGKSLAAGLPLSGVVGRSEILDAPDVGGMGGTYGGNPLALAAALAVFDIFEKEDMLGRSQKLGKTLEARFAALAKKYEVVGEARGLGAMRAVELVRSRKTREPIPEADAKGLIQECARRGLLILKAGQFSNCLRCLVPLVVKDDELERGLEALEAALKEYKPR